MGDLLICRAMAEDKDQLANLWKACFTDDSPEYVRKFISSLPRNTVTLIGKVDGVAVTMLFLLPAMAEFCDNHFPVRYLYAGCTHPLYRGKGYYRRLMDAAEKTVREIGEYAIYLHPADESLDDAYRRMGYRDGIVSDRHLVVDTLQTKSTNESEYMHKRCKLLSSLAREKVIWDVNIRTIELFVCDAVDGGAVISVCDDDVSLLLGDKCIEKISLKNTQNRDNICLWLPVKTSLLNDLMKKHGGYTGMIGD